jgi:protein-L-isoaspartate(D-aspartate) O-methyltransferase
MTTTLIDAASFAAMRHAMVASQLRTSGVSDPRVVEAMMQVPREAFVPEAQRDLAYRDRRIPLGTGRWLNPPLATGLLLTHAALTAQDKVLLIGAATGYTAALLVQLAGQVMAVEEDAALLASARTTLAQEPGVRLVEGPLAQGHAAAAPYDVLLVDGAVEQLPEALVAQLRPGGRIVTGLIESGATRLAAGQRSAGGFGLAHSVDVDCVALPGFAPPRTFRF